MFYQRLDKLMKTFGVSNSQLAKYLSLDSSLVSRWRTGKRAPSKNGRYIEKIALYFCEHAKMDYHKAALQEIMGVSDITQRSEKQLAELLISWLETDELLDTRIINKLINNLGTFDEFPSLVNRSSPAPENLNLPKGSPLRSEVFYGISGKQKSVLRFLSEIINNDTPCILLLYSDESLEWLSLDKSFTARFLKLLHIVIKKGNKIKIIHTLSRDMSEMFAAIDFWIPLYMTGSVEPYYCPKYREHYFRRTMFIAQGVASVICTSLSGFEKTAPNIFSTDINFIDSLALEFYEYLNICRPLMSIFTIEDFDKFTNFKYEFEKQEADCFVLSNSLTSFTMPENLFIQLYRKYSDVEKSDEQISYIFNQRYELFESNLRKNKHTEIIYLPEEQLPKEELPVEITMIPFLKHFPNPKCICYTWEDCKKHISNIIDMLARFDNFNLYICRKKLFNDVILTVKDDIGVIVEKAKPPFAVFAFNQQNMTNAFYYYVHDFISGIPQNERNKKNVIEKLRSLVSQN